MNNLEDMQRIAVCDIFICSHTHQIGAFPKKIIIPDIRTKKAQWKRQLYVSAGAFMDYEGYAIRAGYSPTETGAPYIKLGGRSKEFKATV